MANYLERVASSAGRRAALSKPQMSVPPLLPAGNQLLSAEDSLPADNPFFEETSHAQAARPGSSPANNLAETPRFQNEKLGLVAEAGSAKLPDVSATRSQTSDNSAPSTSDAPFTIHLPKTLRPASANSTQPVAKEEPRGDAAALTRAQPAAARATADEEVSPVAQSAALVIKEFEPSKARTDRLPARPEAQAADTSTVDTDKRQTPAFAPVPGDGPNISPLPSITRQPEPLSAGLPIQIPPVIVPNAGRQERSRVSIGLLEVMVNNQPPVAPVGPPAQPPLQNGKANLARRYLDRFALRR